MHGEEFFVTAVFDNAFAGVVDHDGALLGLLVGVPADVDKCFDDIIEGVVVVVVEYQFATAVVEQFHLLFFL